jgi:hypothetical protein
VLHRTSEGNKTDKGCDEEYQSENPDGLTGLESVHQADSPKEDRHEREWEHRHDPGRERPTSREQVAFATQFCCAVGEMKGHMLGEPVQGDSFSGER